MENIITYHERQRLAKNRLIELCKKIWSLFTDDEREYYLSNGTFFFIEDIATIVGYNIDFNDEKSIYDIHDQIFD